MSRYWSFTFLLLLPFLSLVTQMNLGGHGFNVPPNVWLWCGAVIFVLLTVCDVIRFKAVKSHIWLFLFSGLCTVLFVVGALQVHWSQINSWLPTLLAMLILSGFVWGVLQQEWQPRQWHGLMLSVVALGGVQAVIALIQVFDSLQVFYLLTGYVPFKFSNVPLGSLQQVNMLASFMALCVVMGLWLLLVAQYPVKQRVLLWLIVVLSLYVILLSGSRAGLMAVALSLGLLSISVYKMKEDAEVDHKLIVLGSHYTFTKYSAVVLSVLLVAGILYYLFPGANGGLERASMKLYDVWLGTDLRLYIYQLSWQTFLQSPWIGYGLENYSESLMRWVDQVGQSERFSDVDLSKFQHPHNEILFWLVQTGLVGGIAIFGVMFWAIKQFFKLTSVRFWLLLALLFPLAFQAQLSFPFRLSALHLFYFIVFITVGLLWAKEAKSRCIELKVPSYTLIGFSVLLVGVGTVLFAFWTSKSIAEVYYFENRMFLYQNKDWQGYESSYFAYASCHPFYKQDIELTMQNMNAVAQFQNNVYDVGKYIKWKTNIEHACLINKTQ